jgi:hypothetical protein
MKQRIHYEYAVSVISVKYLINVLPYLHKIQYINQKMHLIKYNKT